jgi:cytochrome P450
MAATIIVLITAFFILLVHLVLNWRCLSSVPGPFLASITDLWRAFHQNKGSLREQLVRLHDVYGPVVRYGVNSVSISDPAAIDIIYSSRAKFTTVCPGSKVSSLDTDVTNQADSYKVLAGVSNGKEVHSLISTDEATHASLRRSVAPAFTPAATLDYETHVDRTIPELFHALEQRGTFNFADMILFYSIDAASRFAFNESIGCLKEGFDVGGMAQAIRDRFDHWGKWSSMPGLERAIFRNTVTLKFPRAASVMSSFAASKLQQRVASTSNPDAPDLLQRFLELSKLHPKSLDNMGILGISMSTISGAGDTTATTVGASFYYLLHNPSAMRKLRCELSDAKLPPIPTYAQVKDLLYLNAVIKESMRLFPIMNYPIERKVPAGGATVVGMHFPAGSTIGCFQAAVHRNKAVYGEDVEDFRPERWLECDTSQLKVMESAHLGFSRGKRVCLGQHIAVMQLKKVTAALAMRYEVRDRIC